MRPSDIASIIGGAILGMVAGVFISGAVGATVGGVLGAALAYVAAKANVRPLIAVTAIAGAAAGALIGASIVETICLPDTCVALEAAGALVLGLASIVGVGLVAALVARSFDEYSESVIKGEEPPGPGCEVPD